MKTQKQATEIQQAAIYRCTDKTTHEVFYMVKSDTQEGVWYQVRFNNSRLAWECGCPATKPCKHERAVQEVLKVRRQQIAAQMGGETPAIVAELQAKEDRKLAQAEKANPVAEAEAFIAKARAAKTRQQEDWSSPDAPIYGPVASLHNNVADRHFEVAPSGRACPMR